MVHVDALTWSSDVTPAPRWDPGRRFFEGCAVEDVLVAEVDGRTAGYAVVSPYLPFPSAAHVQELRSLAVAPEARRRGAGRALLSAARDLAARRGARKLVLRVLGGNTGALALYRSAGYEVEGVLKGLFLLDGRPVDDVLMALDPTGRAG
nr:GNAT family N-acetyltransferase [Actinorugispora endophytica]